MQVCSAGPVFPEPFPELIIEAFQGDPDASEGDTDGDGLLDKYEIIFGGGLLLLNSSDSDGNGVSDGDEDNDGDGLTNFEEQVAGTSAFEADTDGDGLSDGDEVNVYGTDPRNPDSDCDGVPDGRQVANGSDPTTPDAEAIVTSVSAIEVVNPFTNMTETITVTITGPGDLAAGVIISAAGDDLFPGQVGYRYDITVPERVNEVMTSGTVTLPYDAATGGNPDDIAILTLEDGQYVALPTTYDADAMTLTATITHFTPFLAADQVVYFDAISKLARTCDAEDDPDKLPTDAVLVIDSSGSMTFTDPSNLRLSAAKNFASSIKPIDRVAVVDFDFSARLLTGLTNSTALVNNAIDQIDSSGGTNIGIGVSVAINELINNSNTNRSRVIILLTDGEGSYSSALTQQMIDEGIRAFTIGLSSGADAALLDSIATATQGAYKQLTSAAGLVGIFSEFASVFGDTGDDTDGDGLTDCQEIQGIYVTSLGRLVQTDPGNPDTDGDGIPDGLEVGIPERQYVPHAAGNRACL